MKRPKIVKRRLTKTVKISVSMPGDMVEWLDVVSDISEVSRSEVLQWILTGIMENDDVAEIFFDPVEIVDEDEDEEEDEEED